MLIDNKETMNAEHFKNFTLHHHKVSISNTCQNHLLVLELHMAIINIMTILFIRVAGAILILVEKVTNGILVGIHRNQGPTESVPYL